MKGELHGVSAGMSRREFLGRGAKLTGAIALGIGIDRLIIAAQPEATPEAIKNFEELKQTIGWETYNPGMTIPGPVPVTIPKQGWSLRADPRPGEDFVDGTSLALFAETPNTLASPDDSIISMSNRFIITPWNKKSEKPATWRVRPTTVQEVKRRRNLADEAAPDTISYTLDPDMSAEPSVYKKAMMDVAYRVTWYAGKSEHRRLVDTSKDFVVSEAPIEGRLYEDIQQTMEFYRQYMKHRATIMLVQGAETPQSQAGKPIDPKEQVGSYFPNEDVVNVTRPYLTREFGSLVLPHEMNHALFFEFKDHPKNKDLREEFERWFVRRSNKLYKEDKTTLDTCSSRYDAVFALFDESSYAEVGCGPGHPADNADELFASSLNVMRNYADQLLTRFDTLSSEDQQEASEVLDMMIRITDTITDQADGTPPALVPTDSPLRTITA